MLIKGFLKPLIRIKQIGKVQFWAGIIFGIISAFIFSLYFNYARESFRSLTFNLTPLILSPKEFAIYDLFFAALSVSLAFGFTVIIWLTRRKNIKKQYYRMFAIGNAWLIIFAILFLVLRMGSTLTFVLYLGFGYDKHLDFIREFGLILLLLPIYIFFFNWNYLSLMFRTERWILLSIFVYALLTFILFKTTSIDKSILNNTYYSKNEQKFEYIETELRSASKLYGISFAESTEEILKNYYSERTFKLVKDLKKAFNTDSLVSLDTIILEKIVISNLNIKGGILNKYRLIDKNINWPYATPEEINAQIKRYESKSGIELKYLLDILNEMIWIFQAPEIDWNKRYKYSENDIKRVRFKRIMKIETKDIEERLKQIVTMLRYDKQTDYYRNRLIRIYDEEN